MLWINQAQDRNTWLAVVNTTEPSCSIKCREFFDQLKYYHLFKEDSVPCSQTDWWGYDGCYTRVGTLIVATIYLQLIQNRYMFRSYTVLHCNHQHCVQPVASDVEVVGYL